MRLTALHHTDDAEFGDIARRDVDAVEAVRNVDFQKVDRTVNGIGEADLAQYTVERMPKLHGFARSEWDSLGVDEGEVVVNDCPRAAVALWATPSGEIRRPGKDRT
jgi:hypothetical protein